MKDKAERGIYESLIEEWVTSKSKNTHKFVKPIEFEEGLDFANLMPLWETTKYFLKKKSIVKFSDRNSSNLAKPPFGIKAVFFHF